MKKFTSLENDFNETMKDLTPEQFVLTYEKLHDEKYHNAFKEPDPGKANLSDTAMVNMMNSMDQNQFMEIAKLLLKLLYADYGEAINLAIVKSNLKMY